MTPETKVTPEVREAVLSTIQHEAYRTLAGFIMDGLTLEQIQAKVGFDEPQYKSMVDHIAKISAETVVAEPTPEDAPTTVTPDITSETHNATNVPVAEVLNAPEASQPANDANTANTEELTA